MARQYKKFVSFAKPLTPHELKEDRLNEEMLKRVQNTGVRRVGVIHTDQQKLDIIKCFKLDCDNGTLGKEAAAKLDVSVASIRRWISESDKIQSAILKRVTPGFEVDAAIAQLASYGFDETYAAHEAMFKFMAWLRWPTTPGDHPLAVTCFVAAYLFQKSGAASASQLSTAGKDLLLRYMDLGVLKGLCLDDLARPIFEIVCYDRQLINDYDILGCLASVIINYEPKVRTVRSVISLNKLALLVDERAFDFEWQVSERTLRSFWSANASAAPFHYVRRSHSKIDWLLDPSSPTFARQVDDVLSRKAEITAYFRKCLWAVRKVAEQYVQPSAKPYQQANFPSSLTAEEATTPLSAKISKVLKRYSG